jgi:4-hydroxybenzoate polyprenyltransferase
VQVPVTREFVRPTAGASLIALIEGMRPAQWVKNGFVLSPLIFSGKLASSSHYTNALEVFAAFCLAASGVYLWNDSLDWKSDLNHPEKKFRPIPSGRLSAISAAFGGTVAATAALTLAYMVNVPTGLLLTAYLSLNVLYSVWLKQVIIVDLLCIACGFVIRVVAGATAINVLFSHWLLMCTFLIALFLGIAKRRQELVILESGCGEHRRVLKDYKLAWFDQASTLVSASALVAYALYSVAPETQAKFGTDKLIYTVPFVVFGILRYLHMAHSGDRTGNPTDALITDRHLLICVAGWILACAFIIYR